MARPFIDFSTPGATGDSDDTNQAAVKPVIDGDPANAATFNRMPENLRTRTEFIRQALNDLKYLADADKATLVTGGGTVSWGGASDITTNAVTGTGIFTTTADITVRPFMAPLFAKRAKVVIDGPGTDTITVLVNSSGLQAYGSGLGTAHIDGNAYTITFALGGSFSAVLSGTPATDILVTFVSGTTTSALAALMAASATFIGLNLNVTSSGTAAITVLSDTPSTNTLPASAQRLLGAVDAERHVITAGTLNTFFATVGNRLATGDTLAIYYDALFDNAGGGRREAVPNYGTGTGTDKTQVGISGSLFNLRLNPEKAPLAIPVCTVAGDALVFVNQVTILRGQDQNTLSSGFVQRTGDLMTGNLNISPTYIDVSEQALNIDIPALQSFGGGPVDQNTTALRIVAGGAAGIDLTKPSGAGAALKITHAGTDNAFPLASSGVGEVLHITSTDVTAAYAQTILTASANAALHLETSHASGVALIARRSNVLSDPTGVTAYLEGKHTDAAILKIRPSGSTTGTAGIGLDITAPAGTTGLEGLAVQIAASGTTRGLVVVNDNNTATKPAVAFVTGPSEDATGFALQVKGRASFSFAGTGNAFLLAQSGTGPALKITPSGSNATAMVIDPIATALPGSVASGALGTESYTSGAITRARIRSGIGNSERSGTKTIISLDAPWNAGGSANLYYWVDAENVFHLRCRQRVHTGSPSLGVNSTFAGGANAFTVGASAIILPDGVRPVETAECLVQAYDGAPTTSTTVIFSVLADGSMRITNRSMAAVVCTYVGPINIDYPLFS